MQESTDDRLQIAYTGPTLRDGRMPMLSLAAGLRGQALLIHRVSRLLYGETVRIEVEVDPSFEGGSLIIPIHIFSRALGAAEHLLTGEGFTALANLLSLVGFMGIGIPSLYTFFKRLRGRPAKRLNDFPRELVLPIAAEKFIQIYNDREVQVYLRITLEPLHRNGIEEFQTRRAGEIIETISKVDLQLADEAELEDLTSNEEVDLAIEKAAWRRDLAWHFSDGQTSFDAQIDDITFWELVEGGESFANGDRLRVHLRTTARRTLNGTLKIEKRIPMVITVEHARHQLRLFTDR